MGEMLKQTERHPPGPRKEDQLQCVTEPLVVRMPFSGVRAFLNTYE